MQKTFTTEPKTRRHGQFVSSSRAAEFMEHLFEIHLNKCSYSTLEFEFINFYGTNDRRTVERYLGHPEETVKSSGSTETIRMNRTSGKIAQFHYYNTRKVPKKRGLLEALGYLTMIQEEGKTVVILHHERMSYYTKQVTLEAVNLLQEVNDGKEVSKDNSCVSSLLRNETITPVGKECEKTALEVVSLSRETGEIVVREKKEEVIDSTHTNPYQYPNMLQT